MIKRTAKWLVTLSEVKIGLAMMGLCFFIFFLNLSFLETLSLKILDLNFKLRGPIVSEKNVVIVAIDQKSQEKLGRWPWTRSVIADLINRLSEMGALAIGLDIVFSFPEERPDKKLAETLLAKIEKKTLRNKELFLDIKKAAELADVDARLAEAFRKAGNVVPGYFFFTRPEEVENLDLDVEADYQIIKRSKYPITILPKEGPRDFPMAQAVGVKPNIKLITESSRYTGFFNIFHDEDGVARKMTNVIKFNGKYFPSLSIQILRVITGDPLAKIEFQEFGINGFYIGDLFIPSDEYGRATLNFYGPEGSFPHLPVVDVLEGGLPDEELRKIVQGKIVLVGATATGIGDIRSTPFGSSPGVELHATFLQNVIDDVILQRAVWARAFDAVSILGLGLMLTIAMMRLKVFSGGLVALLLALIYVYFQRYMFLTHYTLLDIFYPGLAIVLVYGGISFFKYFVESKERKQVRTAFEHYLSPVVIGQIMKNPKELKLGGEEVVVTAYFLDVKGFSTFSEKMTPTELVDILNEFLSEMTDIIMENGGTLDKYQGDAILAFFGAPYKYEDHALKACRAALLCQQRLAGMREKWKSEGREQLMARIGLNTGKMLVGNMGSKQRFDYTMMGDEANLASRLESANKQYGTWTLISDSTYQPGKHEFETRELDYIRVVGRKAPVRIYELLSFKGELEPQQTEWLERYKHAYGLYRLHKWEEAISVFEKVMKLNEKDTTSWRLMGRCRTFIQKPPDQDWDGVISLSTK